MSQLRIDTLTMPAADLGVDNPLPPLRTGGDVHVVHDTTGIPDDTVQNIRYGRVKNILPYTIQDGYDRVRHPREFMVAVLENELLKATFLLQHGGRLWSLLHKPSGRELLACNPVFQPANLALRNAWFSGGVEWNIGTIGHTPLTCDSLYAARLNLSDGTPVLRLYEWERIRQVTFQIDAYLPDGCPMLLVRVRIVNPNDYAVPMYWWSNMAVPESQDTRVIVPATTTYQFDYREGALRLLDVPAFEGTDMTYTTNSRQAADYFFHIPDGQQPWITALGTEGKGLIQCSTNRLQGRKLFMWGQGIGGKNWQDFLSVPGKPYLEIQAGLARTQLEHLPMPAHSEWAWLEGYGLIQANSDAVHGDNWLTAINAVQQPLNTLMPRDQFEAEFKRGASWADRPPDDVLLQGSGWGTLERLRREMSHDTPMCGAGLIFDERALNSVHEPWLHLLRTGEFPASVNDDAPYAFLTQPEWRTLLENASNLSGNWLAWLHLGIMRYAAGEREGTRAAWTQSLAAHQSAWTLRNLAVLDIEDENLTEAALRLTEAQRLQPDVMALTLECCQVLTQSGIAIQALTIIDNLSADQRSNGRVRLTEGQAALAIGDFQRVAKILATPFVVDTLREGEPSLSDLWFNYHEQLISSSEGIPLDETLRTRVRREFPLAQAFDFRMSE
ncbi:MAG: DUF5107 domain-containing protein [Anaerolineae bacterium]